MRKNLVVPLLLITLGILMMGLAVYAAELGLDRFGGWGRVRLSVFILGVFISLCTISYLLFTDWVHSQIQKLRAELDDQTILKRIGSYPAFRKFTTWITTYGLIIPAVLLVLLVYVWFASDGTWTTWNSPTRFYADLARGFERGVLYLPGKLIPESIELPNPYDPQAEWGDEVPIDVSFYEGKLYLHWGPVPALLLVLIDPFIDVKVGDLQLVFAFVFGIFLVQSLLITFIWDRFFYDLPKWLLFLSILLVGLTFPTAFALVGSRNGRIYEASVTAGQFFMIAGFLSAYIALLGDSPSKGWLACTGILWALAIGSRLFLIVPNGLLSIMFSFWIVRKGRGKITERLSIIPLLLPLLVGLLGLGWYNWARFGSIAETGIRYQWPGWNLHKTMIDFLSPAYIVQNLYNYLFHPFAVRVRFPFFIILRGISESIFPAYSLPPTYGAQRIAGLFFTSPFVIFSIPALSTSISYAINRLTAHSKAKTNLENELHWISLSLGAAFLSAFGLLMMYFWAASRFIFDFIPSLQLLSLIGFWQSYQSHLQKSIRYKYVVYFGIGLAIFSIISSTLLALSI